jgi:FtsZ-binding cell division protein ZapB
MALDLSDLTVDELVESNQDLGRQVDELREQRRAINVEIVSRNTAANEAASLRARLAELEAGSAPAAPAADAE